MALDALILGPFYFDPDSFEVPDRMPFGGDQQMTVHKMPGGYRTIDCMGPDDHDRSWRGIMWGDSAFSDMLTLDALRVSGQELPFSWGAESRTVVIHDFKAEVQKYTCIHYSITVVFSDDSGGGGGFGGLLSGLDSIIGADLSAATAF